MTRRSATEERTEVKGSYSMTVRVEYSNEPGMLGRVATTIGAARGDIGAVDLVDVGRGRIVRDITVSAQDSDHARLIIEALKQVPGLHVRSASDQVFIAHVGGKIEIRNKVPVNTRQDLSVVYTPGVARVSLAIAADPEAVWNLTTKRNTVAVVTDGTAVLGLGDIGPAAALPVMEGKAMLFKAFAGVDAWPICLATKDVDEIVRTVRLISPAFGGVNLEDIAAPRCFEIENRLREETDIPVFHDDQHGTAVVVLAGLINALKIVGKSMRDVRVAIAGAGAAGNACAKMLLAAGAGSVVVCDRRGILYPGREGMDPFKEELARLTNPEGGPGSLHDAIAGADIFVGVSGPDIVTEDDVRSMRRDPIVFALSNPNPEIRPELAHRAGARVVATGRSDYPNQVNNALCFPGLFRGVLDVRARVINEEMKLAAAQAIAATVGKNELSEENIIPSIFNRHVASNVAREVARAAQRTGVARRHGRPRSQFL